MGAISRQTRNELRHLPLTLGKVVGGLMTALGLPAIVVVTTRTTAASWLDAAPWALTGIAGLTLFVASSRAMARQSTGSSGPAPKRSDRMRMSILAWALLAVLVAGFAVVTIFLAQ